MNRSQRCLILVLMGSVLLAYDSYTYGFRLWNLEQGPVQMGVASWYGREEQGKLTANGERFNRSAFTAAHRQLPFNTVVRVTNRENGRSVVVRINDRGPYRSHRILDLSEAAADSLGIRKTGIAPVKVEVLPPDAAVPRPKLP